MRRLTTAVVIAWGLWITSSASAWKPITHVALAEMALEDAKDGTITLDLLDKDGNKTGVLGPYAIDPQLKQALASFGDIYRAGALGPDAYPDILTGQMLIHPHAAHGGGSDAWLRHIWQASQGGPDWRAKVFALGYLTHAAGDMFGHTFINNFSGGEFTTEGGFRNAIKHVFLEGYLAELGPQPKGNVSIAGVEDFIHRTLVAGYTNPKLDELFRRVRGDSSSEPLGTKVSIPYVFSKMRERLQCDVDRRKRQGFRVDPIGDLVIEYKKAWVRDIDAGLHAWVHTSHKVAKAMMYNRVRDPRTGKTTFSSSYSQAKAALMDYVRQHLLSMLGAPDLVGKFLQAAKDIGQFISKVLGPIVKPLKDLLAKLKNALLDLITKKLFGKTVAELKELLTNKKRYFDKIMRMSGYPENGQSVTLANLHQKYLHNRIGQDWSVSSFAPAYNTVVISKLVLLPPKSLQRLRSDLQKKNKTDGGGPPAGSNFDNVMLGFMRALDKSAQWQQGMVLKNYHGYVFKRVAGESKTRLDALNAAARKDPKAASAPEGKKPAKAFQCFPNRKLGQRCGDSWECSSNTCDRGMGSSGTSLCVPAIGRGSTGQFCTNNKYCRSGSCSGHDLKGHRGKCVAKSSVALGKLCQGNSDCKSGSCDRGPFGWHSSRCIPRGGTGLRGNFCTQKNQCRSKRCGISRGRRTGTCG